MGSSDLKTGDHVRISVMTGTLSNKTGVIVDKREVKTDGKGVPTNVAGAYEPVDWKKEVAIRLDGNKELVLMFKDRVFKIPEVNKVASLRGKLVRLAHENLDARPHLLSLLRKNEK
jgi:hypothetical protein